MFIKLRRLFSPRTRGASVVSVTFDDNGFTRSCGAEDVRLSWADVREVFAYKIDRFTVDDLCVGFCLNEAGDYGWISEEDAGYAELVAYLPKAFPGIRTDWFRDVAFPAFVENRTTLWARPRHAS